ncbi:DUF4011 domain-containing protein [Clostridium botulinum]|uniref:DUF4011 domain-containing protein n=1 Tax=Clostridium botulinum TaxID=1491 RepID=A0A6M0SST9_CLOBO|nr:DUF4011 domain-containing protein [Clostridium botulinum]NFA44373.1 DUF4011 domain-containing protein [Clostridium botulinum]
MSILDVKLDSWKKKLLDLGKRNRMINYKENKRSSLQITNLNIDDLFEQLVIEEKALKFSQPYHSEALGEENEVEDDILKGDIETNLTIKEQQKLLNNLRNKAKLAKEEQGINTLYLSLGFLEWIESYNSKQILLSPIILVPVRITLESLTDPFLLSVTDDDIVVNPTLAFKLEHDFGIILPEFNNDEESVDSYLNKIKEFISINNWKVNKNCSISLLSFLKINMYKDLENNIDKIRLNPIVTAIAGEKNQLDEPPAILNNYNHDKNTRPLEIFQILDADSSQQDAILYAKKGISFVLQGPPGTGKSQTITNIISEALAEGKKVLFVSEKMAALEVVYNRLSSSKLGEFCLTLHSHKANKKQIIKELYEMLNLNKVKLRDEALYDLEALQHEKEKLNEYSNELHKKCEPLNKSIYDINGMLSKLLEVENVIFNIDNIKEITKTQLNEYKYYLEEFSHTLGKNNDDFLLNPWKNSNVNTVTNELRHDIEKHLKDLLPNIRQLSRFGYQLLEKYDIPISRSIDGINKLQTLFEICNQSPTVPFKWFEETNIEALSKEANELNETKTEYKKLMDMIKNRYDEEYLLIDANKVHQDFNKILKELKPLLNNEKFEDKDEMIVAETNNIYLIINDVINDIEVICNIEKNIENIFDIENSDFNIKFIINNYELLDFLLLNPKPTLKWFEDDEFDVIKKIFYEMKQNYDELTDKTDELLKDYDIKILDVDFENILIRFKIEYTSFLKIFKKNYKHDKKIFKTYSNEIIKNIDDKTIIDVLNEVKRINNLKDYFSNNKETLQLYFGNHFKDQYTNFEELKKSLDDFDKIRQYFKSTGISKEIRNLLLNGDMKEIIDVHDKIYTCIVNNKNISLLNKNIKITEEILKLNFNDYVKHLEEISNKVKILSKIYNEFRSHAKDNIEYSACIDDLNKLIKIQSICLNIEEKSNILEEKYQFLYKGINSDWLDILEKLEWVGKFKKVSEEYALATEFKKSVCSDTGFIKNINEEYISLVNVNNKIKDDFKWFNSLFEENELLSLDLELLVNRLEDCLNNISLLEGWIDYRNSRKKCREIGLGDYIDKIENMNIKSNMIIPIFLKRFYRLWLDNIIVDKPTIGEFRRAIQEERINQFIKLDINQFEIAKYRIRERLINSLPNMNFMTSCKDEVGILKREASKQRKIMPLRKLFSSIPELILTLKPCLMMSPLSVSMFLECEDYKFDLVIFDEASQVCTEDAIGAIYRGKQVIVVGDKEQLPPTNFFSTSLSDSDFDSEEEENVDDSDSYESVLDEALSVMPERTLLWHYRSRHEHLIAFSNFKIYGGSLVTFPSNVDKVKDNGVEYIYVKDGVYEKNGKRCNLIEAKKVAEMVFEHIKNFPKRSLGVVTFSQAQQHVVELALIDIRKKNSQYEEFFNEDNDEPFFIKNLENVQGDERDTIIFSIGYAKDINGKMYMNFGPLSRVGGYRRLNVAITRAKYNVKLVGSILPTDIDLERTNAEGVKMLRSYIEFAIQGTNALINEIKESEIISLESPFEESVYEFLISKGYNVATQVGCSGYRIDLAIKHPNLSSTYVLGIECDGATYHNSRTARERDRLRQSVLENIGWKIYRIWSTDWIKDKKTEGNNLIEIIEKSIASYDNNIEEIYIEKKTLNICNPQDNNYLIPKEEVIDKYNHFGFEIYKETDLDNIKREYNESIYLSKLINYCVDKEYPIHFELLCRKIAPFLGNQKVTVKIKNIVSNVIQNLCRETVEIKDNYCWIKNKSKVVVRIPEEGTDEIRQIQYISKEELAEAMITIIDKSFGINSSDLISITAKVFGFNRVGIKLTKAINNAYKYLIEKNRIIIQDDRPKLN